MAPTHAPCKKDIEDIPHVEQSKEKPLPWAVLVASHHTAPVSNGVQSCKERPIEPSPPLFHKLSNSIRHICGRLSCTIVMQAPALVLLGHDFKA